MTLRRVLTVAALGVAAVGSAHAQTSAENRDADALAADMRLLAANPDDIEALIVAGELTLKMGDPTAAAGFFGRAEKLDPNNPRVKAGWGSLMLRAERPGDALRRFQEAEARGLPPVRFAADRGLAYDLIGQQERAQRDYRLVLRDHVDDEVTRRYALSLGISGNKDEALRQLDPLIRRSDRAAWRGRAFVLAMSGDAAGADRIATTMMAPGMGAALAPFFRRLPQLSPTDRAFAVTFGELRAGPERIADARMTPSLPPLGPDPYAPRPVVVAVAAPVTPVVDERGDRKRKKHKDAALAPAVTPLPTPAPRPGVSAPAPPVYVASTAPPAAPSPAYRPPVTIAVRTPSPSQTQPAATPPTRAAPSVPPPSTTPATPVTMPSARAALATPSRDIAPPAVMPSTSNTAASASTIAATSPAAMPRPVAPSAPAATPAPATPSSAPAAIATAPVIVAIAPVAVPAPPRQGVADQPSAAEAGVAEPTAIARVSEDSLLARIVADASAAPTPPPAPRPARVVKAPEPVAPPRVEKTPPADEKPPASPAKRDRKDAATADAIGKTVTKEAHGKPVKVAASEDAPALDRNGCPAPPAKGRDGKGKSRAAVKQPPLSARCRGIAAKVAADKEAEAKARSQPARVWVQVAGGANEASLQKSWQIMRDRAPDLLRGRSGWTTPLRATNRVLAGPFKSEDEAQEFVNKLTKAGVPAFVFTSAKGQKIEKLGSK